MELIGMVDDIPDVTEPPEEIQVDLEGERIREERPKKKWRKVDRDYEAERVFERFRIEQRIDVSQFKSEDELIDFMNRMFTEHEMLSRFGDTGKDLLRDQASSWYQEQKGIREAGEALAREERERRKREVERRAIPTEERVPEVRVPKPPEVPTTPETLSEDIRRRVESLERQIREISRPPEAIPEVPSEVGVAPEETARKAERAVTEAEKPPTPTMGDRARQVGSVVGGVAKRLLRFIGIGR